MNSPLHIRASILFLSISLLILNSSSLLINARTLTWSQLGGGSLQSSANWDGGVVPTSEDDVVIKLKDSNTNGVDAHVAIRAFYSSSNPWESSASPSSSFSSANSNLFTLTQPWSIRSLTVSGPANLIFDTQVHVSGSINLGKSSMIYVKSGQLEAQKIDVHDGGVLSLDLAQIGSAQAGTLPIHISAGSKLYMSSPSGANHFINSQLTLSDGAEAQWEAGPLILDSTLIQIDHGATFQAQAEILTQGSSGGESSTNIKNSGRFVFNSTHLGTGSQQCSLPILNEPSGTLIITGPLGQTSEMRILNTFKQAGQLQVSGSRILSLSFTTADFNEGSHSVIDSNAIVWCQSGETSFKGKVSSGTSENSNTNDAGGEILISSLLSQLGEVDINRVTLQGGVLQTANGGDNNVHSVSTIKHLKWLSGRMVGPGEISIGHPLTLDGDLILREPSSSKVLNGPKLHLYGSGVVEAGNTLLVQGGSTIHVHSTSTLVHEANSAMNQGDESNVKLQVDKESTWKFLTQGAAGSSGGRSASVITLPVSSDATNLLIEGDGEVLFRSPSQFRTLTTKDHAGVRLQGLSNHTTFTFIDPIALIDDGQYLLIQNSFVDFQSAQPSTINSLGILDATLQIVGGLELDTLTLGSATMSAVIEGKGLVNVKEVHMNSGEIQLNEMRVSSSFLTDSSNAKFFNLKNLTFLGGSTSHFHPGSAIHVTNDLLHWWLHPNATLILHEDTALYANRPADYTGQPCLHNDGLLVWRSGVAKPSSSVTSLEVMNRAIMRIEQGNQDGATMDITHSSATTSSSSGSSSPFTVQFFGGLTSSPSSTLLIHSNSIFESACPQNMTTAFGCTFGRIQGEGELQYYSGVHSMMSPINITSMAIMNGHQEFYSPFQTSQLNILDGETILHGYGFTNQFQIRGGHLIGFPVLNSALVILPTTSSDPNAILFHNTTLTLTGLMFICEGVCESRSTAGYVFNEGAQLVVAPGGRFLFATPATVYSGSGGGGQILNAGELAFSTPGTSSPSPSFQIYLPILNRGLFTLRDRTELYLYNYFKQDSPRARFLVANGAEFFRGDGGSLEFDTGEVENLGSIYSQTQIGGRLIGSSNPQAKIYGDVVFSPMASMAVSCSSSSCTSLNTNGTIYLNGLANITFDSVGSIGHSYSFVSGKFVIGSFTDSSSNSIVGGPIYKMDYTPTNTIATITGMVESGQTVTTIPAYYDLASHGSPSVIMMPNLSPSPATSDMNSFSSIPDDMSNMHHMMSSYPDSMTINNNLSSLVTSQPIILQEASNVSESSGGVFGMSEASSEGLLIFLFIFSGLITMVSLGLLYQSRHAKEQLTNANSSSAHPQPPQPQLLKLAPLHLTTQLQPSTSPPPNSRASTDLSVSPEVPTKTTLKSHLTRVPTSRNLLGVATKQIDTNHSMDESINEGEDGQPKPIQIC